jgi:uncharacterized membrane protein YcjF (UPF0283 family)
LKDGTVDEQTTLAQFLDDLAVKPGTREARSTALLVTVLFAALTITLAVSAFQAIWDHHLWTGIAESAATLLLFLLTLVLAVMAALEWTSLATDLD